MIKILWRAALFFSSLLIIALIFLLSSSGLKFGLFIGSSLLPGQLHYQNASGLITGPIRLTNVDYRQGSQEIHIKSLQINWNLWALLVKKISLSQIKADHIDVIEHRPPTTKAKPFDFSVFYKQNPFEAYTEQANVLAQNYTNFLTHFKWSWSIRIANADLSSIVYYAPKHQRRLELNSLKFQGEFSKRKMNISLSVLSHFPYSTHIQAKILGSPQEYQFDFSVSGKQINFIAQGRGNDHQLHLSTTKTSVLNGKIAGNLDLDWKNDLRWKTDLMVKEVNFSLFYPAWSQHFQAHIQSQGHLSQKNPAFSIQARIKTNDAYMNFNIQHQQAWLADWEISLAQDKYHLKGNLTGPFSNPNTTGILNIRNFSYQNYSAARLSASWKMNLGKNAPLELMLSADQLIAGNQIAKHASASFTGTLNQHQITLSADFDHSSTQLNMSGAFSGKTWTAKVLRWNWGDFHLPSQDLLKLSLTFPNYTHGLPQKSTKIDATLDASLSNLSFITDLVRDLNVTSGKIAGRLHVRGTLEKPLITGEVDFSQGTLLIPSWDLKLTHARITSSAIGHLVKYTADAISGKNPVHIIGETNFAEPGIPTRLQLSGKDILLVDTPEYTIYGSPNVTATIVGSRLDLKGNITIPNALIRPHDFRNTTQLPTNEVVFIGTPKVLGQSYWEINTDLTIIAGKHVVIDSFGIQGLLDGAVHIVQTPNQTLLANGKIGIHHGLYRAYGHQLKISHGSFMQFTNSPISNPVLSIEATRRVTVNAGSQIQSFASEKMTVGMNIHGPLSNPDINLFSSSGNLSQSEILSYILTGGGTSTNSTFGAPNMNAGGNFTYNSNILDAIKLGASGVGGTESLLQKIQSGLGFTELGIESDTTLDAIGNPLGNQTNFVIGRHITKDLYIRYTRGIYGPGLVQENLITLRYLIRRNWAIQLETSEFSNTAVWGADILYTSERD